MSRLFILPVGAIRHRVELAVRPRRGARGRRRRQQLLQQFVSEMATIRVRCICLKEIRAQFCFVLGEFRVRY